jgi:hypothetical protein
MRLVINHIVSEEDKEAISKGLHGGVIDCFDLTNFETLRQTFDEYQQQFFECLAFLIYDKRIDIRIIKPRNKKGISHTKSGQFRDGDSITSFTGSANFTISGLFNNLEEIKIDRSDSVDKMVQNRIASQREEFDSIMKGKKRNIEYLSPENLISAIQSNFGDKDIEELLDVEKKLRKIKAEKAIKERQEQLDAVCEDLAIEPRFPYPLGHENTNKQLLKTGRTMDKRAFSQWQQVRVRPSHLSTAYWRFTNERDTTRLLSLCQRLLLSTNGNRNVGSLTSVISSKSIRRILLGVMRLNELPLTKGTRQIKSQRSRISSYPHTLLIQEKEYSEC